MDTDKYCYSVRPPVAGLSSSHQSTRRDGTASSESCANGQTDRRSIARSTPPGSSSSRRSPSSAGVLLGGPRTLCDLSVRRSWKRTVVRREVDRTCKPEHARHMTRLDNGGTRCGWG